MPPFVRNGGVAHRAPGTEQRLHTPVAGLVENLDCPFPATNVFASDGNNQNTSSEFVLNVTRLVR